MFVLTHRPEDQPAQDSGLRFVNGLDTALALAGQVAGDKDIGLMGGQVIRQVLAAGRLDELIVSIAPVVLGGGKRLFEGFTKRPLTSSRPGRCTRRG
jgi:dihydrofolate reductase